jgi:predicted dehydrogenase
MRRLKVGVVGGGVGVSHIDAYQQLPDHYEVVSICDIDAARAERIAAEKHVPKSTTRLADLLALDLDLVDIATPSNLHFAQATEALKAGRNVALEKPAAASLAEVDELKATVTASGKTLIPIFQYRFANGLRKFLHLKAHGLVGKPYIATVETHWRRRAAYYATWHGTWAGELGGCLVTLAIHSHDIMTQVMGPPASVFARVATRVNPIETEDCVAASLEMQSGALVTLSVTTGSAVEQSRLRFCFEGLLVESSNDPYNPGFDPWTFTAEGEAAQKRVDEALAGFVPLKHQRWLGQIEGIHDALTGGAPPPVTLDEARASIELLTAAYCSSRTGQSVKLPIGRDHPYYRGWQPSAAGEV